MKLMFYLGHPAHFHLFKNVIGHYSRGNGQVYIYSKKKDILDSLLSESGVDYENILPEGRKNGLLSIGKGLFKRDALLYKYAKSIKPDLIIGTSSEIAHISRFTGIPSLVFNDDDISVVPYFSFIGCPFARVIICPESCKMGIWKYKTIHYSGYQKLAYLHPDVFKPNSENVKNIVTNNRPYCIIRLVELKAHHDSGIKGLSDMLVKSIINQLSDKYDVYISSERELPDSFKDYQLNLDPLNIHDAIAYSSLFIGDSQSMVHEAAVLGVPNIRFNDFSSRIGVLEELEHKYGLTYGIKTSEPEKLLGKIEYFINNNDLQNEWHKKRDRMLSDVINLNKMMMWIIDEYPNSIEILKENPEYQHNFK